MAITYAVFTFDLRRPLAFQAVRHSERDLTRETADAERERLQAEYDAAQAALPEEQRRPLTFFVWMDRGLPADLGFNPRSWEAHHAEPVERRVMVKGIGPAEAVVQYCENCGNQHSTGERCGAAKTETPPDE